MQKMVVANWKSNKTLQEAQAWYEIVENQAKNINTAQVLPVVTPPYPFLVQSKDHLAKLGWQLAVQDLSPFPTGSYTGAVSARNLQGLQVKYAIVGHSERKQYFQETPVAVAKKVEQALENGITPIVCVDQDDLAEQANAIAESSMSKCVVAYEPLDSIGTGNNASLEKVKAFREKANGLFDSAPFIYGGSVDEQNIAEYLLVTDGVLVGTASLEANQFMRLLQAAQGKNLAGA